MSNEYTSKLVEEGQSFEDFMLTCARAFGAYVSQRDGDKPKESEIETCAEELELQQNREELARLEAFTPEEKQKYNQEKHQETVAEMLKTIEEKNKVAAKINEMIKRVEKWEPPTEGHKDLKDFAFLELHQTRAWDCDCTFEKGYLEKYKESAEDYYEEDINQLKWSIEYNEELIETVEPNVKISNDWVEQLERSLK